MSGISECEAMGRLQQGVGAVARHSAKRSGRMSVVRGLKAGGVWMESIR